MRDDAAFDPDNRALYTALFRAPEGYAFDRAAATTYSLDFETALAVLMAIAADDTVEREVALAQPLALLHAVRRLSERITIYCDRGRIQRAPSRIASLMSLCEQMILEVAAPGGGAFHPKIWCVRFTAEQGERGPDRLRLAILSRNLTPDRSWDLSLMLDGEVGKKADPINAPLVTLMKALSGMAAGGNVQSAGVDPSLLRALSRCAWDLPMGAKTLAFAVNGIPGAGEGFSVPKGERLAIVSPFVTDEGLQMLRKGVGKNACRHLISRAVELDGLSPRARAKFETVQTMDDAFGGAAVEGEEDGQNAASLHAKAMLVETGSRIAVCIGSANATGAALLPAGKLTRNVEVMATLSGTIRKMGGIDNILLCDTFSKMLDDYTAPAEPPIEDSRATAEKQLEKARGTISAQNFELHCSAQEGAVALTLQPVQGQKACVLPDGVECFMQMLAAQNLAGLDAAPVLAGDSMALGTFTLSDLTRWIRVRLHHAESGANCTFMLGAVLIDAPAGREAAALRAIIDTKGFLAYIALLLGGAEGGGALEPGPEGAEGQGMSFVFEQNESMLEPLVRALCGDGDELAEITHLLKALRDPETGDSTAPEEFLDLWRSFAPLVAKGKS